MDEGNVWINVSQQNNNTVCQISSFVGHYLSNRGVGKNQCDGGLSCASHSDGFYLDRTKPNCQSYIQCLDHRVANHSRCPYGQRFNRNMGRCTPADQVPCLGRLFDLIEYDIILHF